MMKKLLLLMAAGFMATGSFAQSAKSPVVLKDVEAGRGVPFMIGNAPKANTSHSANKNTVGGERWLEPWAVAEAYNSGAFPSQFVYTIGWDTTYLQTFTNGASPVNWVSFGQFFDPIYSEGFNFVDPNYFTEQDIQVTLGNDYTVDSIYFRGAYMEGNKYPTDVDTVIISAAPVAYSDDVFKPNSTYDVKLWEYEDVEEHDSTLRIQKMPILNRSTRGLTATGAVTWKVALEDTLRKPKTADGSYPTRNFFFAVNNGTPLNVPKGRGFAYSVSFKPGKAQVAPNADSVTDYNYLMFTAKGKGENDMSPYYYYSHTDRNMSFMMHYASLWTTSPDFLSPVELELYNGPRIRQEFIINGAKITCATCQTLSVKNVNNTFNKVVAYPNPAKAEVRIPFILNVNSDVKVTLTNAIGQVVKSQSFKNVNNAVASFNVVDLTDGTYIYTVEANGQRESGRIAVTR